MSLRPPPTTLPQPRREHLLTFAAAAALLTDGWPPVTTHLLRRWAHLGGRSADGRRLKLRTRRMRGGMQGTTMTWVDEYLYWLGEDTLDEWRQARRERKWARKVDRWRSQRS